MRRISGERSRKLGLFSIDGIDRRKTHCAPMQTFDPFEKGM